MKTFLLIALGLLIAVFTIHAQASDETQEQRDRAAQATLEEARKAYNVKSDDEYQQEQHEDDKAAQQGY